MFKFRRFLTSEIACRLLIVVIGVFFANEAMAAAGTVKLATVTSNVTSAVKSVANMLEDVAIICGVGFILAAFFKFHQHKLNPTQVPMSQGITLLVIGAGLSVFPHLLGTGAAGIFGASVAKLGSAGISGIIST